MENITKNDRAPRWTERVLRIPNGDHELPATVCLPAGEGPFPAVVLLHGTGSSRDEAGNAYLTAARCFAEEYGLASLRFDFMGCGESTAAYRDYTFDSAVSDAAAAGEYLRRLPAVDPERIGVLGWSQGGTDALLSVSRRPGLFKSVVTWAGAPDLRIEAVFTEEQYAQARANGFYLLLGDWHEPLEVSLRWCEDVLHTDVLGEFAANYTGPVLAIHGREDVTVDPVWCGRIAAASGNPASATLYLDGADHTLNVFTEADQRTLHTAIRAAGEFFGKTL